MSLPKNRLSLFYKIKYYKSHDQQPQEHNLTKKERTWRGAFHKAGFTYRNLVGRWLAAAENKRYMQRKRREMNPRPTIKGVRAILFVLLFNALLTRYSVLHLLGVLSGGNEPPLCKGRWLAQARRRDCIKQNSIKTIPQPPSASAPFTQGSLWFVRTESPSTFPDKHCICGHKS